MAPTLSLLPLCNSPELEKPGATLVVSKKPPTGVKSHVNDVMNSPPVELLKNWNALLVPNVVPAMIFPLAAVLAYPDVADNRVMAAAATRFVIFIKLPESKWKIEKRNFSRMRLGPLVEGTRNTPTVFTSIDWGIQ